MIFPLNLTQAVVLGVLFLALAAAPTLDRACAAEAAAPKKIVVLPIRDDIMPPMMAQIMPEMRNCFAMVLWSMLKTYFVMKVSL